MKKGIFDFIVFWAIILSLGIYLIFLYQDKENKIELKPAKKIKIASPYKEPPVFESQSHASAVFEEKNLPDSSTIQTDGFTLVVFKLDPPETEIFLGSKKVYPDSLEPQKVPEFLLKRGEKTDFHFRSPGYRTEDMALVLQGETEIHYIRLEKKENGENYGTEKSTGNF